MKTFFDKVRDGSSGEVTLTIFFAAIILFAMGIFVGQAIGQAS